MSKFVIGTQLIPQADTSSRYYYNTYNIAAEVTAFLVIVHLHIQKKINDARLKAMLRSLREGTLLRRINTYHCPINDQWYNDEAMLTILLEVYNDHTMPKHSIPLDVFLKYLNLYLGKNKNFCIDWVYFSLVKPLIDGLGSHGYAEKLRSFGLQGIDEAILSYEEADRRYDLSSGYCCSDCDGCRSQYKRSRYEHYYAHNEKKTAEKLFKAYLLSEKTESSKRNPLEKLRA